MLNALDQVAFLSLDDDELDARLFADGLDVAGGLGPFGAAEVGVDGEDGAQVSRSGCMANRRSMAWLSLS